MTTDTEALVRRAYHLAEGDVLDAQESYRGEQPSVRAPSAVRALAW